MLNAISTWLTRRRLKAARARQIEARAAYKAAVARKDSREIHATWKAYSAATHARIRADMALSKTRFPHKRSERGTHEIARGFR